MSPALNSRVGPQILSRQSKAAVVTPLAVDVQIAQSHTLVAKAQLLDHPKARRVLRPDVDLDPMKPQPKDRVVHGGRQREGSNPLSCNGFGNPVPCAGRTKGAPGHTEQMHLADQPPPGLDGKGLEPAFVGLAIELSNQLAETRPPRQ